MCLQGGRLCGVSGRHPCRHTAGGVARRRASVHTAPSPSDFKLNRSREDHSIQQSSEVPVAREREQAGAMGGKRGGTGFQTFTSLRHRDFVLLWLSNLCNGSATQVMPLLSPNCSGKGNT